MALRTIAVGVMLVACGQPQSPADLPSGNGNGGSSSKGGGAGTSGQSGQGGLGVAGTGGENSSAGSAGSSGGSGGSAGSGDVFTCNPGTNGDGIHDQPEPYGGPPEAFAQGGVPAGTLAPLTPFASAIYDGHEFGLRVYVPAQYSAATPAALMIVQDGPSHYLGATDAKFFANIVLDNLIAEGAIPVSIGVFVDPCMTACESERVAIYDDVSDKFSRMLTDELIPSIAAQYSLIDDADARLLVGFSAGGIQSFTSAWHQPDHFHKLIGHNTSFPAAKALGSNYAELVAAAPKRDLRVSLVSGTNDLSDQRGNWLAANQEMASVLAAKGNAVRLMTGSGGHYPPDQSAMDFPNALRWIWQGCP